MIGIRSASNGSSEKEKMRSSLRGIIEDFMNVFKFDDMLSICHQINYLDDTKAD